MKLLNAFKSKKQGCRQIDEIEVSKYYEDDLKTLCGKLTEKYPQAVKIGVIALWGICLVWLVLSFIF